MKQLRKLFVLAALGLAILLAGCWGSDKSTSVDLTTAQPTNVGDTICEQCHSATLDPWTQQSIVTQYERSSPHKDSAHANNGNGCEACHGSGSLHYGQGPIPYPNPFDNNGTRCADCHKGNYATDAPTKFAGSLHANMTIEEGNSCRRCHTHEGAVLGNIGGLTGSKEIVDNPVNQGFVPYASSFSPFECSTCHEHGAGLRLVMARDNNSNLVNWNPDKNQEPGQFDLCTSCHTIYDYTGNTLLASGTPANAATGKPATGMVGHHETSWYRIIATTHFDNPATDNIIEGYNLRKNTENPCFDCHGHEARAGTRRGQTTTPTIYTDWAQSPHAGGLLKAKYAGTAIRTSGAAAVDTAMISGVAAADSSTDFASVDAAGLPITLTRVTNEAAAWVEDNWDNTLAYSACQRCHTATGASNYLTNPATYDPTKNTFLHLSGWTNSGSSPTYSSPQNEVLYCWGCHKNAAKGLLRTPGAITASYKFQGANAVFPDVGASDICISCHSGRESGESVEAITSFDNVSFKNSHYLAVGGLMYVKSGFRGFISLDNSIGGGTTTYRQSLTSTEDGGLLSSTHRKLGTPAINGDSHNQPFFTPGNLDSNGPCVTCHMQGTGQPTRSTSHTWEINMNAANEVCSKCHAGEVDNAALLAEFIEVQAEPFDNALMLAANRLLANYNISYNPDAYPYFYDLNIGPTAQVKDWTRGGTVDGKKLMGACFNINLLTKEPAAYVHARTYARRLLYDTIDFLDDGTINLSTSDTAVTLFPALYVRGALASSPETTENYKYLTAYSRQTGAWNAIPRP